MINKKNINNLFQENFENFELEPEEMVWQNIKTKLEEKKEKRRILPFWWRLSGVAAALIICFFVYNKESKKFPNNGTTVAHQDKKNQKNSIESNSNKTIDKKEQIANSNDVKTAINKDVVNGETKKNIDLNSSNRNKYINTEGTEVVSTKTNSNSEKNNSNRKSNRKSILPTNKEEASIVAHTETKKSEKKLHLITPNNPITSVINENVKIKKAVVENSIPNSKFEKENIDSNIISSEIVKSGVVSEIKTNLALNPIVDSTKVAVVVPNELEQLLQEKDSAKIIKAKLNRWQISSNLAPIYFGSISNGSPLDAKLDTNDKAYSANNSSYGLGVNYVINKKLKVRTGVNVLNVEYTTNGIVYYQNNSTNTNGKLSNLSPNFYGSTITIESLSNVSSPYNKMASKSEGSLNQKFGYIEMPFELTYKILNKKLGVDLIGGISTMMLNKNEIYLKSEELNLKIGEANNLNPFHLSGNLGLGLKYGLFKNLDARLEPIIKYQFNTFSKESGNFKPYVFGVYSGIIYSF